MVTAVHGCHEIELRPLVLACHGSRAIEIQHGVSLWPEQRALTGRRQKPIRPVQRSAFRSAFISENDECRQVLARGAEPVCDPRSGAGIPRSAKSAVHLKHRRSMIARLAPAAFHKRQPVSVTRRPGKYFAHPRAALAVLTERKWRPQQRSIFAEEGRDVRFLSMVPVQFGLGIKQIERARSALHEQPNYGFGLWRRGRRLHCSMDGSLILNSGID